MAHALIVNAYGAPGSFARRCQEDPTIAVNVVRVLGLLYDSVSTIIEETTSGRMGFGNTPAEKKQRADAYAAAVYRAADKLDSHLAEALKVLLDARGEPENEPVEV